MLPLFSSFHRRNRKNKASKAIFYILTLVSSVINWKYYVIGFFIEAYCDTNIAALNICSHEIAISVVTTIIIAGHTCTLAAPAFNFCSTQKKVRALDKVFILLLVTCA